MTGETVQPGGRSPAPGELRLVQAFVNSHYDLEGEHGADLLASTEAAGRWLLRHGLVATDAVLDEGARARLVAVREGLRALARDAGGSGDGDGNGVLGRLNAAAAGAGVEVRFSADGPMFVSAGDGVAGAVGLLLALVARAMLDGSWRRLKVCPGADCGWLFYDHSRNLSGRWCSMSVCGGREKARAHYRRKRARA